MALETYEATRLLTILAGLTERVGDKLDVISDIAAKQDYYNSLPLGTTHSMRLHPTAAGRMIKVDLVEGKHQHIPSSDNIAIPGMPVSTIIFYNEGTAQVGFSTNKAESSTDADVLLKAGETFTIKSPRPSITRFHLVAPFSDADIRVLMVV